MALPIPCGVLLELGFSHRQWEAIQATLTCNETIPKIVRHPARRESRCDI